MTIKKCKIDGIRNCTSELLEEDLIKILDISKNIKLVWPDEKYIEFKYAKNSEFFNPECGFYPQNGSWEILGINVEVKKYSLKEFLVLCKSSEKIIALDIDTSNIGLCNELFQNSNVTWYTDYSQLVSFLEKNGYLTTYITENWLSVDGRKFKLNKKSSDTIKLLKNYNSFYEVDSLGTTLFIELTKTLELLYETIQKSLK